jgi:hypothetical protein
MESPTGGFSERLSLTLPKKIFQGMSWLMCSQPAAKQAHANFHEALESLHADWLWHRDGDLRAKHQDRFESAKLPIEIMAVQQRWKISSETLWHRKVGYGMKYIAGSIPRYLKATLAFRRQCLFYRQEQAESIRQFAQLSLAIETYAGRHLPEEMIRHCTHRHDLYVTSDSHIFCMPAS